MLKIRNEAKQTRFRLEEKVRAKQDFWLGRVYLNNYLIFSGEKGAKHRVQACNEGLRQNLGLDNFNNSLTMGSYTIGLSSNRVSI